MNTNDPNNTIYLLAIAVAALLLIGLASWMAKRRFSKLNGAKFEANWKEVQGLCGKEDTWPLAVINGDKLVDDALKKRGFKGKTMGERLVAAQRKLSDNDGIWFGHKLRNKLVHEEFSDLKKKQVLKALSGFRQALRDLGALR